jgi:WD domain, G-beta repeat/Maltose operon periplasmic protein precursor (MalM)
MIGFVIGGECMRVVICIAAMIAISPSVVRADPPCSVQAPKKKALAHSEKINALAITPDGTRLMSGSDDYTIKVWTLSDGSLSRTLRGHREWVHALAVTPDGKILVSGSGDKTVRLWSLPNGRTLGRLTGHTDWIWAVAASSSVVASAGKDKVVRLWSLADGTPLGTLAGHTKTVRALAMNRDGTTLVSGGEDKSIRLWSIPDGKPLSTLTGHTSTVLALAVSADGAILASAGADKTIRLWSLAEARLLTSFATQSNAEVRSLAFTPDQSALVSAAEDHVLRFWSVPAGTFRGQLTGGGDGINSVVISADGTEVFSGDEEGALASWRLAPQCFQRFLIDPTKGTSSDPMIGDVQAAAPPFGSQSPLQIAQSLAREGRALAIPSGKAVTAVLGEDSTFFLLPNGWETTAALFRLPDYDSPYDLTITSLSTGFSLWHWIFAPTALFLDADLQPTHELAESEFSWKTAAGLASGKVGRMVGSIRIDEKFKRDRFVLLYTAGDSVDVQQRRVARGSVVFLGDPGPPMALPDVVFKRANTGKIRLEIAPPR